MKKFKDTLIAVCGITSIMLIALYFPFAGIYKFNFGIYGFNAIGACVCLFIFILCMSATDHLSPKEKKDEISESDKLLINKLEKNPDLLNKVMVELRKRKINKLKQKI